MERFLPGRLQRAGQGTGAEQHAAGAGPHRQQNQQGVPEPHYEGAEEQQNSQGAQGTSLDKGQRKVGVREGETGERLMCGRI